MRPDLVVQIICQARLRIEFYNPVLEVIAASETNKFNTNKQEHTKLQCK